MHPQTIKSYYRFILFFAIVSILVGLVVALRSYLVPFNHDEAATFFMFIQPGKYLPFYSQVDANNHVLNSFLGHICFHVFGSSPFALRLPSLLGFVILIVAVFKLSRFLQHPGSKLFLVTAFLISFHWISFFSACRGYGLSLAFLLLGIAYLLSDITLTKKPRYFFWMLLAFQLAISANLILIIVVLLLSGIVLLIQLANHHLFRWPILLAWTVHFSLIYFWLSFSFFLQDHGALYYGAGESYWKITFVSLIDLVIGFSYPVLKWILVSFFLVMVLLALYVNKKGLFNIQDHFKKPSFSLLFLFVLGVLCVGFYLMHQVLGVNYPEDRTGLFFYVFFVLLICFTFDKMPFKLNQLVLWPLTGLFVIHFFMNLNFRKHSLNVYETIPEHFYTTLEHEQMQSPERITIGGHRVRELFFGFINYRHGGYLNPADPVETMQMNCDYYLATRPEEKYYAPYYEVIDTEPDWGFVVLKRKEKLVRHMVFQTGPMFIPENSNEFTDIYFHGDTSFIDTRPLIAEVHFSIDKLPVPPNTWLVFQINDSLNQPVYFKRYPLQWTGYDLNGKKNLSYSLISGNLPTKSNKIAVFFWNIDQKPFQINVHSLTLFQVNGKGVEYVAPDIR